MTDTQTPARVSSMTGFARAETTAEFGLLSCELKTVNHRYFELSLRLPEELRPLEITLRKQIGAAIRRGKCDATFKLQADVGTQSAIAVNADKLQQLAAAANQVAQAFDQTAPVDPLRALGWPGVVSRSDVDAEALAFATRDLTKQALDTLNATRQREGAALAEVLAAKAEDIDTLANGVREKMPQIRAEWEAKLRERVAKYTEDADITLDENRVEQEFLLLANKSDVEEELDRLAIHTAELRSVLTRCEPIGRRLDFLMQELNREANTLASKSQDPAVTQLAVDLKVAVEQAREQALNVE